MLTYMYNLSVVECCVYFYDLFLMSEFPRNERLRNVSKTFAIDLENSLRLYLILFLIKMFKFAS